MDKMEVVKALLCDDGPSVCTSPGSPWIIGQAYLIRTVTNYWTGRIVSVGHQELVIEDAAWIADTGRFNQADSKGTLSEVEPVQGQIIIGRGSVIDAIQWKHQLPRTVK